MLKCFHILKLPYPFGLDVSGFNESGYNRQVTKVGGSMSARRQQHARDWRWVLCAVKRNHGRKEVLKHPTETNTAIQYGLFGCINHEATRKSTYEATLKCDRIGYVDSVPLPWPPSPPIPTQSTISRFTSLRILLINCYSCFSRSERSMLK